MLQPYSTDDLISAVRRDCFLATSDENWTEARILGVANDCVLGKMAPIMKSTHQNWFGTQGTITLVASATAYDVPRESMWNGVSAAYLRDTSNGLLVRKLTLLDPGSLQFVSQQSLSIPYGFWVDQTQFNVAPTPDSNTASTYDLQIEYYRRPAQMIVGSSAVTIASVTAGSMTVTTSTQPTYFTTNAPDPYQSGQPARVDIYKRLLPYTRRWTDLTCALSTSTSVLFNGSVTQAQVNAISSGDIMTVMGTTIFPDLPPELHPTLFKMVSSTIKVAQGDAGARDTIDEAEKETVLIIKGMSNRTDQTARKLSLYNSAASRFVARGYRTWRSDG